MKGMVVLLIAGLWGAVAQVRAVQHFRTYFVKVT